MSLRKLLALSLSGIVIVLASSHTNASMRGVLETEVHSEAKAQNTPFELVITPNQDIHLDNKKPTVFVTHLDKQRPDESHGRILELAVSKVLRRAQENQFDVIAFRWWKTSDFFFDPHLIKYWAENSTGGSFDDNLRMVSPSAIVTGGQFVYCAAGTVGAILRSWSKQRLDGRIALFLPGMYDRAQNTRWPYKIKKKAEKAGDNEFISVAEILDRYFKNDQKRFEFLKSMAADYLMTRTASYKSSPLGRYRVIFNYRGLTKEVQSGSQGTITIEFIHPENYDDQSLDGAVTHILKTVI